MKTTLALALSVATLLSSAARANHVRPLDCKSVTPGTDLFIRISKTEGKTARNYDWQIDVKRSLSGGASSAIGYKRHGNGKLNEDLTGKIELCDFGGNTVFMRDGSKCADPTGTLKLETCALDSCEGLRGVFANDGLSAVEMLCNPAAE